MIATNIIPFDLTTLDEIPIIREESEDKEQAQLEEIEIHLDQYRVGADETNMDKNKFNGQKL